MPGKRQRSCRSTGGRQRDKARRKLRRQTAARERDEAIQIQLANLEEQDSLNSNHGSDSDRIDETPRPAIDSTIQAVSPRHSPSKNLLLEQQYEQSTTSPPNISSLNEYSVDHRPEARNQILKFPIPERSVVYRPESPPSSTSTPERSVYGSVYRPESPFSSTFDRSVAYRPETPCPLPSLIRPAQQHSAVQLSELLASLPSTPTPEEAPEKKSLERQAREVSRSLEKARTVIPATSEAPGQTWEILTTPNPSHSFWQNQATAGSSAVTTVATSSHQATVAQRPLATAPAAAGHPTVNGDNTVLPISTATTMANPVPTAPRTTAVSLNQPVPSTAALPRDNTARPPVTTPPVSNQQVPPVPNFNATSMSQPNQAPVTGPPATTRSTPVSQRNVSFTTGTNFNRPRPSTTTATSVYQQNHFPDTQPAPTTSSSDYFSTPGAPNYFTQPNPTNFFPLPDDRPASNGFQQPDLWIANLGVPNLN
ncbi:hypothetical protein DAPPUDRAFT_105284 [Daphnia pulex]|uniref:Uncharacterized protein n=1 Tax=Daphnia pulex TaxID=6669 RepID=E9GQ03_DAPPU|nr:hypothetical protein DAPPUDRAFT_105284 [Daphnia pulex]|eukprot:EFX78477.1 hypothetical protein DAPPUDRAFT_105284 [Daphnia pulex]